MPCFAPIRAFQGEHGGVFFVERGSLDKCISLPCGRCIGCLNERCRQWSVRCMHESQMHLLNCVVTLTYDDDHLPYHNSLSYADFQSFIRALRKRLKVPIRYFVSGEYGEQRERPHFHACLFGIDFLDKVPWKTSSNGSSLFSSPLLSKVWTFGQALVGEMSPQSAMYVAGYVHKKRTGWRSMEFYRRLDEDTGEWFYLEPEFSHCSLKPGIGSGWIDKFGSEVFLGDSVIVNGKEVPSTKYYDKLLKRRDRLASDDTKTKREFDAYSRRAENTPERLKDKETVLRARLSLSKRSLK